MCSDLLNCWTISTVVSKESKDEVFEFGWKIVTIDLLEICVDFSIQKEIVEVFFLSGFLEWEYALNNDEKDDTDGEKVNFGSFILFALFNFWSHVRHSTSVRLERVDALVTCKSEVRDLEIKLIIDQDVFKFQVSVNDSLVMHIFEGVEHLM